MRAGRRIVLAGLLVAGLSVAGCTSKPTAAPPTPPSDLKAIVSTEELMQDIFDPMADHIFDAVTTDVTAKGVIHTVPHTDEEWARVRQGAVTLAEASSLLKIPRAVAPQGDKNNSDGPNAPELSPEQIQAKIDQDRASWNRFADELRDEAFKVLAIVKARNVDALFQAGSDLDRACENCHLEYWYPGDKKSVLEDAKKRVTITPPKK